MLRNDRGRDVRALTRDDNVFSSPAAMEALEPRLLLSADLVAEADLFSGFDPGTIFSPGGEWNVWCDIRNQGDTDAAVFSVYFYASGDAVITPGVDKFLGATRVTGGIKAGEFKDVSLLLSHFPAMAGGDYYVGIVIDALNEVDEGVAGELNNTDVDMDTYPLVVINQIDLLPIARPGTTSFAPDPVKPGDAWSTTGWDIRNAGLLNADEEFIISWYASVNTMITRDDILLGSWEVDHLDGGQTIPVRLDLAAFPEIMVGDYYIGLMVDSFGEIVEADETNNKAYIVGDTLRVPGITGTLWHDIDGDGALSGSEPTLPGRTVYIDANDDGDLTFGELTSTTDEVGMYSFAGLPAGPHTVRQVLPSDWAQIYPLNNDPHVVQVVDGEWHSGNDFGDAMYSTVTGIAWHDSDGDLEYDRIEAEFTDGLTDLPLYDPLDAIPGRAAENWGEGWSSRWESRTASGAQFSGNDHGPKLGFADLLEGGNNLRLEIDANEGQLGQASYSRSYEDSSIYRWREHRIDWTFQLNSNDAYFDANDDDVFTHTDGHHAIWFFGGDAHAATPSGSDSWAIYATAGVNGGAFQIQSEGGNRINMSTPLVGYTPADGLDPAVPAHIYSFTVTLHPMLGAVNLKPYYTVRIIDHTAGTSETATAIYRSHQGGNGDTFTGGYVHFGGTSNLRQVAEDPDNQEEVGRDAEDKPIMVDNPIPSAPELRFSVDGVRIAEGERIESNFAGYEDMLDVDRTGFFYGGDWEDSQWMAMGAAGWTLEQTGFFNTNYYAEVTISGGDGMFSRDYGTGAIPTDMPHSITWDWTLESSDADFAAGQKIVFMDGIGNESAMGTTHSWGIFAEGGGANGGMFQVQGRDDIYDTDIEVISGHDYQFVVALDPTIGHYDVTIIDTSLLDENGVPEIFTVTDVVFQDDAFASGWVVHFGGETNGGADLVFSVDSVNIMDYDFPLAGWTAFIDDNNNGSMDVNDMTAISLADGRYTFDEVLPGYRRLREEYRANWLQVLPDELYPITVTSDAFYDFNAFGNAHRAIISGQKWQDLNQNGLQNTGDRGLGGWTIYIDANENGIRDDGEIYTISDTDGRWELTNLTPGYHLVGEVIEPGWMQTVPLEGQGETFWRADRLRSREDWSNFEFGNFQYGRITGKVWHDLDADGVFKQESESLLAGQTIAAYTDANADGILDDDELPSKQTVLTDETGYYLFPTLDAAAYIVMIDVLPGWDQSAPEAVHYTAEVTSGSFFTKYDFGAYQPVTIFGMKFDDLNADGDHDPGEPGLLNWQIYLDQNANNRLDAGETSAFTNIDGLYSFPDLVPGRYFIREIQQPENGWIQSAPQYGAYDVNITSGHNLNNANFGNYRLGTLSGIKWNDANIDAVKNSYEVGLAGWTIYIDDNSNSQLDPGETSTVTGAGGAYTFTDLVPGSYRIDEVMQDDWYRSYPRSGWWDAQLNSYANLGDLDFGNYQVDRIVGDDIVYDGVTVTASSQQAYTSPERMLDGAGLADEMHGTSYTDMWLSELGVVSPTLRFDLGAEYLLSGLQIWNYNQVSRVGQSLTDRGVKTADVWVSVTGIGDPTTNPTGWRLAADDLAVSIADGLGTDDGTSYELAADGIASRYVLLMDITNWGGTHTGLSEVRFRHVGAVVQGVSVTASSSLPLTPPQRIADRSGLSDGWYHNTSYGDMWLSQPAASPTVRFDLGGTYKLSEMRVWNCNQVNPNTFASSTDRGFQTVDVYVSVTGIGDPTSDPTQWRLLSGDLAMAQASGAAGDVGVSYELSPNGTAARYVLFDDVTNWGGSHTGLSEVRFSHIGEVVQGVAMTASSQNPFTPTQRTVDRSGLANGWNHSTSYADMWLSQPAATPTVRFDLGEEYFISEIRVWNYNQVSHVGISLTDRGVRTADIYVSVTGIGDPTANPNEWTLVSDDLPIAQATGVSEYDGISYGMAVEGFAPRVRYVVLTDMTNWGGTNTGLSEVQFVHLGEISPGDQIEDVASVTASSQLQYSPAGLLINGSGLVNGLHDTNYAGMWLSERNEQNPTLRFDLGATYILSGMHLWNYNQVSTTGVSLTNRGLSKADVYVSVNGLGDPTTNPSDWFLLSNDLVIDQAPGNATYAGKSYELSADGIAARYVMMTDVDNWAGTHTGLSEVRFSHLGAIVQGASAAATSQLAHAPAGQAVDGSGLANGWHHSTSYADAWLSKIGATPEMRFDLGETYLLTQMRMWNCNQVGLGAGTPSLTNRGIHTADVYVSVTGIGTPTTDPAQWELLSEDRVFAQATGDAVYDGTLYQLSADGIAARHVLLTNVTNWGGTHTGLSEVQFTHRGVAVQGVSATASSQGPLTPPIKVVDGSGLSNGWHHGTSFANMWLGEVAVSPTITFDLGGTYLLSGMHVWNFNQVSHADISQTDRGFRTADVYISTTGTGDPTSNPGQWTLLSDDHLFDQAPGDVVAPGAPATYAGTSYELSADGVMARYVVFTNVTNWGGLHSGLSEVQFWAKK